MPARFVQNPDVAWRLLPSEHGEEEAVLLAIETTTYYSLDPVGTFIWKQFENPTSSEEVLGRILETYEVDRETAAKDLDELLGDLISEKLLVEAA